MVIYTVLIGKYDNLRPALFPDKARYICFSDEPVEVDGWEYRHIDRQYKEARRDSRRPKLRPDLFLPKYQVSLYHDANFQLLKEPVVFCEKWLADVNLAFYQHPWRDCLYDEAKVCKGFKLDVNDKFDRQTSRYRLRGMPFHWGLFAGGVLLRRHMEPDILTQSQLWWDEYVKGSNRDQISLAYSLWLTKTKYQIIPGDPYNSPHFSHVGR